MTASPRMRRRVRTYFLRRRPSSAEPHAERVQARIGIGALGQSGSVDRDVHPHTQSERPMSGGVHPSLCGAGSEVGLCKPSMRPRWPIVRGRQAHQLASIEPRCRVGCRASWFPGGSYHSILVMSGSPVVYPLMVEPGRLVGAHGSCSTCISRVSFLLLTMALLLMCGVRGSGSWITHGRARVACVQARPCRLARLRGGP